MEEKLHFEDKEKKIKYFRNSGTESIDNYAKSKKLKDVKSLVTENENGARYYLLGRIGKDGQFAPIFEHKSQESIAVHIDMIWAHEIRK